MPHVRAYPLVVFPSYKPQKHYRGQRGAVLLCPRWHFSGGFDRWCVQKVCVQKAGGKVSEDEALFALSHQYTVGGIRVEDAATGEVVPEGRSGARIRTAVESGIPSVGVRVG